MADATWPGSLPSRERSQVEDQDRLFQALADRYLIEREIGSGGMATVYLQHDGQPLVADFVQITLES